MNPDSKDSDFKYNQYISTCVDGGMTFNIKYDKIIKGLGETYMLGLVRVIFDENICCIRRKKEVYNVNKLYGRYQEIYPFMSTGDYVEKLLSETEEFYNLSK